LQLLLDSKAALILGSEEPHYTASKLFPYIMSKRPLLAVFREESNVVRILHETRAGHVETFSADRPVQNTVPGIRGWFANLLSRPAEVQPQTDWNAFEQYTTYAMTARLAGAFETALGRESGKRIAVATRATAS
jgi:hypothetical protein